MDRIWTPEEIVNEFLTMDVAEAEACVAFLRQARRWPNDSVREWLDVDLDDLHAELIARVTNAETMDDPM